MVGTDYYDASDPAAIARAGRENRSTARRDVDDLYVVLKTLEGRRAIFRIMVSLGLFEDSADPSAAVVLTALRSRALDLRRRIRAIDPALMYQMEQEYEVPAEMPDG